MGARSGRIAEQLSASLWFVPSLMVLAAVAAAVGLVYLDAALSPELAEEIPWMFSGGPEGARDVLTAIATAIMTVVGVTFSITIVTLTLAAQEFTPLVIRQFVADRGNQVVLGGFLGVFLYCLVVLRSVRTEEFDLFVPQFAVTGGVVLALVSVFLLIYFIHHVAAAIQPSGIVARVAEEAHDLIDHLYPDPLGRDSVEEEPVEEAATATQGEGVPIVEGHSGYLEAVDSERLIGIAREADLVVRVERMVGQFVSRGVPVATAWPADRLDERARRQLGKAFAIGRDRTLQQDPEYALLQMASIGVKALSTGINDPNVAIFCLHYLGDVLRHMGDRALPSRQRRDRHGCLRVIAPGPTFPRMVNIAFDQIREYGAGDATVLAALLDTITSVAEATPNRERRGVLRRHVDRIVESAEHGLQEQSARDTVRERAARARRALDSGEEFPWSRAA